MKMVGVKFLAWAGLPGDVSRWRRQQWLAQPSGPPGIPQNILAAYMSWHTFRLNTCPNIYAWLHGTSILQAGQSRMQPNGILGGVLQGTDTLFVITGVKFGLTASWVLKKPKFLLVCTASSSAKWRWESFIPPSTCDIGQISTMVPAITL